MVEIIDGKNTLDLIEPSIIGNLVNSVKSADPLGADMLMNTLGNLNAAGRVDEIIAQAICLVPNSEGIHVMSPSEAHAALRDLGMISASVAYHGRKPFEEIPGIEEALIHISEIAEMVPRDSLFSYCFGNPDEEDRRRTYSGTQAELFLIEAVNILGENMTHIVYGLETIYHDIEGDHSDLLVEIEDRFTTVLNDIVQAKQNIPTHVFRHDIGDYFLPLSIAGKDYEPPSAAHTNLLVMDYLVWGSDCVDKNYKDYIAEYSKYLPKPYRDYIALVNSRESLVSRLESGIESGKNLGKLTSSLSSMLNRIYSFRSVHFTMATERTVARPGRDATVSSKHLNPNDSLHNVMIQTIAARERISNLVSK